MKKDTVIMIIRIALCIGAIVFLALSFIAEYENRYLAISMGCISISTLINIRYMCRNKNK